MDTTLKANKKPGDRPLPVRSNSLMLSPLDDGMSVAGAAVAAVLGIKVDEHTDTPLVDPSHDPYSSTIEIEEEGPSTVTLKSVETNSAMPGGANAGQTVILRHGRPRRTGSILVMSSSSSTRHNSELSTTTSYVSQDEQPYKAPYYPYGTDSNNSSNNSSVVPTSSNVFKPNRASFIGSPDMSPLVIPKEDAEDGIDDDRMSIRSGFSDHSVRSHQEPGKRTSSRPPPLRRTSSLVPALQPSTKSSLAQFLNANEAAPPPPLPQHPPKPFSPEHYQTIYNPPDTINPLSFLPQALGSESAPQTPKLGPQTGIPMRSSSSMSYLLPSRNNTITNNNNLPPLPLSAGAAAAAGINHSTEIVAGVAMGHSPSLPVRHSSQAARAYSSTTSSLTNTTTSTTTTATATTYSNDGGGVTEVLVYLHTHTMDENLLGAIHVQANDRMLDTYEKIRSEIDAVPQEFQLWRVVAMGGGKLVPINRRQYGTRTVLHLQSSNVLVVVPTPGQDVLQMQQQVMLAQMETESRFQAAMAREAKDVDAIMDFVSGGRSRAQRRKSAEVFVRGGAFELNSTPSESWE